MAIKVLIQRKVPQYKQEEFLPLLLELKSRAVSWPGYMNGEILKNLNASDEHLVISTWKSLEDWEHWAISKQRLEIQNKIDLLLGGETSFNVYTYH
jgi:antibiotic biosynthesis monooxygenase (ABM) superfamily enzyme